MKRLFSFLSVRFLFKWVKWQRKTCFSLHFRVQPILFNSSFSTSFWWGISVWLRPEGAEEHSPGQRPGYKCESYLRPVRAKDWAGKVKERCCPCMVYFHWPWFIGMLNLRNLNFLIILKVSGIISCKAFSMPNGDSLASPEATVPHSSAWCRTPVHHGR